MWTSNKKCLPFFMGDGKREVSFVSSGAFHETLAIASVSDVRFAGRMSPEFLAPARAGCCCGRSRCRRGRVGRRWVEGCRISRFSRCRGNICPHCRVFTCQRQLSPGQVPDIVLVFDMPMDPDSCNRCLNIFSSPQLGTVVPLSGEITWSAGRTALTLGCSANRWKGEIQVWANGWWGWAYPGC